MKQPILELRHLSIYYKDHAAVKNFSLSVGTGEIVGIAGESGSGKSTVLRAVLGLLGNNARQTDGQILFQGQELSALKREELRRLRGARIGMIFQNCRDALCPVRRIGPQVYESVAQHQKTTKREVYERAAALLKDMNLKEPERILKSYPFELSGGMNQRVGIMMAMLMKPDLLLADEPTSSLDRSSEEQVLEELKALQEKTGTAIVLVSHDRRVLSKMAGRIVTMSEESGKDIAESQ